jgi:hypothetical protein
MPKLRRCMVLRTTSVVIEAEQIVVLLHLTWTG